MACFDSNGCSCCRCYNDIDPGNTPGEKIKKEVRKEVEPLLLLGGLYFFGLLWAYIESWSIWLMECPSCQEETIKIWRAPKRCKYCGKRFPKEAPVTRWGTDC